MKKLLLSLALGALFCMTLSAQEHGEFRFGVTGGANLSNTTLDATHYPIIGYNAGFVVNYGIGDVTYLSSGVKFSQKGVRWTDSKCTPGYIDIPLHYGYRMELMDGVSVFGEAGLYAGFGITGKMKYDSGYSHSYYETVFSDTQYSPNRFEAGLDAIVGVELFESLQIRLGYEEGLTKMTQARNSAKSFRVVSLGIAYMFN